MKKDKEIKLNKALDKIYSIGFALEPEEELETYFSEKLMVIGTTVDEKFNTLEGMRKLIANQREQSQGMETDYKRTETFRDYQCDDNIAIITEDVFLTIRSSNETFAFGVRTSLILHYEKEQWKLIHWHASKPEQVESEKDTFGMEDWKQKTTALEKLVEERTADLTKKNRELEIESSLERVRTVAMSMQKPDDLLKIAEVLYKELVALGFDEIRNALIQTFVDGADYFLDYDYSDFTGGNKSRIKMKGHATIEKFIKEIRESKAPFAELEINNEELEKWKQFRKENNEAEDPRLDSISSLYYYCYAIGSGSIGMSTYTPISAEKKELLKRFRNVFDFAYRRYTDVAQAEAQTREAQIEAALERVRSRSLAMHRSSELEEVIMVVSEQLQQLKFRFHNASFVRYDENNGLNFWLATPGRQQPFLIQIPYLDNPIYNAPLEARKAGLDFIADIISPEENHAWLQHLVDHAGSIGFTEKDKKDLLKATSYARSLVLMNQIILVVGNFAGIPYTDEQNLVLKRFARVFDQSYTRFLDLQKAEAQAKEAQIEAGLERVRSRSLAMHRSDELQDIVNALFERLSELDIQADTGSILIYDKETRETESWIQNPAKTFSTRHVIPFFPDSRISRDFIDFFEHGEGTTVNMYGKDDKDTWFGYLFETSLNDIPQQRKDYVLAGPHQAMCLSKTRMGGIYLARYYDAIFTPEETSIIKRFATVFEQAYTRFLDLQKAEAQAREAQIEAALERVRSKTMAMHNSNDVGATVIAMFAEFENLGIHTNRCGILIFIGESSSEVWTARANPEGNVSLIIGKLNLDSHNLLRSVHTAWKAKSSVYRYDLIGDDLVNYYEAINRSKFYRTSFDMRALPSKEYHTDFFFAEGAVFTFSKEPVSDDHAKIIKRFAGVFGQTYRRYLDLQKAEAQARESQIEAALERVRAKAMAMHRSEDLHTAVAIVFEELDKLNLGVLRVGISVLNKEKRCGNVWLTSIDEGKAVQVYGDESFDIHPLLKGSMDAWINHQDFYYVLEGDDLVRYYQAVEQAKFRLPASQMFSSEGIHKKQSCFVAVYNSGGLFAFRDGEFPEEAKQVMRRFASVFDLTYKRYLDIQQAEAQARQAKIEAALEKVRSRTLAMQKSDELAETAAVLFQQLIQLGIAPSRLYITIVKDDTGLAEFWITDEDGSKVSLAYEANLTSNPTFQKMFEGWKKQQDSLIINLEGEELQNYLQYLSSINVPFKGGPEQKRRVQHIAYFSHGFIGLASQEIQPAETISILDRFAYGFNLTFTRFNDLKLAEAHALQAEQDLTEIKEARRRAEETLSELQSTQKQLIQSEKMASLGELTAGIAHEIQNPLNFVNNFSEVSNELIDEMVEEVQKGNYEEAKAIAEDVKQNLSKISHHGKRADGIVKGMLQHSRSSSGQKELTDINQLSDEYLRLAYHGLRAKDKSFNAKFETELDPAIGKISVMPQEIGRVVLNLINNAFYAVSTKANQSAGKSYTPTVIVSTTKTADKVEIRVKDNGYGIPTHLIDKIFQPFFTTKPTGQGTGLGLSLSYDIITKGHAGELKVETKENEGTVFTIILPA